MSIRSLFSGARSRTYKIGNSVVELSADHSLPDYQAAHRLYDRFLPVLANNLPPGWIIDVGANVGDTAIAMREHCCNPVLCIEADREIFGLLLRNVRHMSDVRCVCELAGVTKSVDAILGDQGIDEIALFKVDTDGEDAAVIKSGMSAVSRLTPMLFWENYFSNQNQRLALEKMYAGLHSLGYRRLSIFDNFGNVISSHANFDMLHELNSYVASQDLNGCTRTIHYTDVLASVEGHDAALSDYREFISRHPPA